MSIKIQELGRNFSVEVYAIYWVNGVRYQLIVPYSDYIGLITVNESKCEVTDPSVDGFILTKSGNGGDMLVHWAAEKDALLDRMIDHDPEAMEEFERRLKEGKA